MLALFLVNPPISHAQGMMGRFQVTPDQANIDSTTQEEAKGKAIWEQLQAKQIQCKDLKDDDFDVLGEYFMGQRLGASHANMNAMMKQMMGDAGETQMHITLGKRLSGCDPQAAAPVNGSRFMPMMGIDENPSAADARRFSMMGGNSGSGFNMMRGTWSRPLQIVYGITWLLGIIFLSLGIIYFWKGIMKKDKK